MRRRHGVSVTATGLVVVVLAAGCTAGSNTVGTEPPGTASASATAPAPTLSDEEQAVVAAEAAYREWNRVRRLCMDDPANTFSTCFNGVAVGEQLQDDKWSLFDAEQMGAHAVGEVKIVSLELVSVDLTDRVDQAADPDQGIQEVRTVPTVVFAVCTDRGDYDLVDSAGESRLGPSYSRFRRTSPELANHNYPDPEGWRVSDAYKGSEVVASCES